MKLLITLLIPLSIGISFNLPDDADLNQVETSRTPKKPVGNPQNEVVPINAYYKVSGAHDLNGQQLFTGHVRTKEVASQTSPDPTNITNTNLNYISQFHW